MSDVLAKPAEAKPVEAKPVEAKPVEAKPIEAKVVEAKVVEAKPRVAKRMSMSSTREPTYRVSKTQSLRMLAYDKKVEAAEAKKNKASEKPRPM
jgi:hypothetical protein